MPGIKAKPGSVRTDMIRDETGVYHMRLQEKRPREVINIDSQDGNPPQTTMLILDDRPTSKQKLSHPGQKSRFFGPLDTVAANPVPTPLEREAASRGLPPVPTNNEAFANPYSTSADLPNRLADDFKKSNVSVVVPGNRWRGLAAPPGRGIKQVEMRHTGGTEVHLSWGMVNGEMEQNLFTRIGDEVRIYRSHAMGERLAMFKVSDVDIVQVQTPQSR